MLVPSDAIQQFKLNTGERWMVLNLIELVKRMRPYFASQEAQVELITKLRNWSFGVSKMYEEVSNMDGNARRAVTTKVEGAPPQPFKLCLPIYKGYPRETFEVEFGVDAEGSGVKLYMDSPQLLDLLLEKKEQYIKEEVDYFTQFGCSVIYQQPDAFAVPAAIEQALREGAALAISLSGGKDSQALLMLLAPWFRARGFAGQLFAIHADLGRAEWEQTPAFVQQLADNAGVPLVVVRRAKGDLVARIGERMQATAGTTAPGWPDAKNRYCTSHLKSGPIDQALRNPAPYWPSSAQRFCTSDLKRGPIDTQLRQFE
nr:hypothetical protein [Tanacetum cinerariifolium]